ncbi:MAG: hypothetical protein ABIB79_02915 [archaeon]
MVRQDILGGLKEALSREQSLKQAMITFLNAGYNKRDIENAARFLLQEQQQMQGIQPMQPRPTPSGQPIQKPLSVVRPKPTPSRSQFAPPLHPQKPMPIQPVKPVETKPITTPKPAPRSPFARPLHPQKPKPQLAQKIVQKIEPASRVSTYAPTPDLLKDKIILGVLIFILFVLLGLLASTFIFKEQLMVFLDKLFGI